MRIIVNGNYGQEPIHILYFEAIFREKSAQLNYTKRLETQIHLLYFESTEKHPNSENLHEKNFPNYTDKKDTNNYEVAISHLWISIKK